MVQGAVTTKLKGAWKYNITRDGDFSENCSEVDSRDWLVYDPADYVIPPQVSTLTLTDHKKLSCVVNSGVWKMSCKTKFTKKKLNQRSRYTVILTPNHMS